MNRHHAQTNARVEMWNHGMDPVCKTPPWPVPVSLELCPRMSPGGGHNGAARVAMLIGVLQTRSAQPATVVSRGVVGRVYRADSRQ